MSDRADIHEVMGRYAGCMDEKRWTELGQVFAEDGSWTIRGTPPAVGRAAIVQRLQDLDPPHPQVHIITNPVSEIDGDRADLRCYLVTLKLPDNAIIVVGKYEVALTKVAGDWKIQSLVFARVVPKAS